MKPSRYKRQTLALFFIVSLVPALTVAAIWYLNTQFSASPDTLEITFKSFVLPIFLIGVFPAMILSFAFAELLADPVRRIRAAVDELAKGNFKARFTANHVSEFHEISEGLDHLAMQLEQTLAEAASEKAIIEAERNKLRGVLDSMTDGVFALDRSGRIILFNRAAATITGRSMEEVAGQLAEKVMPLRQGSELVMERWLAQPTQLRARQGEWRNLSLYRADGAALEVNVRALAIPHDPNGISALITFHDITSDKQLEEMKVDFVALAAHELRTPLTQLRGTLDVLQHESKLTTANRELLQSSVDSAGHLSKLINNLLGVARIEHGEINYHPERIDYHAFVTKFGAEATRRVDAAQRKLTIKLPRRLPEIWADPDGLHEVLTNLLDNAVTYTEPHTGQITITVELTGGELETSVSDNGGGIPAGAISHLFTKFYRVHELSARTGGTGLGLYISKSIVEAHGGQIWAESTEGQGSTFSFRLPLQPVAPDAAGTDNVTTITRGAHGWIKEHSIH